MREPESRRHRTTRPAVIALAALWTLALVFPPGGFAREGGEDPVEKETEGEGDGQGVSVGIEVDFCSRYLWHGFVYNKGLLAQPAAWISAYDLTLGTWNNLVLHDPRAETGWDETDLTLSYAIEWRGIGIEPSFSHFLYPEPGENPATGMIEVRLSYALSGFEIYTLHAFDLERYRGAYCGEAGLSWEGAVAKGLEIAASANLGWASARLNEVYAGVDHGALDLASLGVSLRYFLFDGLYVRPHAEVFLLLDGALSGPLEQYPSNFGVVLGFES